MAVGSSLGHTFEDPFDFIVKTAQMNAAPSDSEAGSKPEPVISSPVKTTENAKAALSTAYDLLVPGSLKPETPEETHRKLKAFEEAKPGDKVPEMENPALKMIAGATDVAAMGIPVKLGGVAKVAAAAGAGTKFSLDALEAEIKALLQDIPKAPKSLAEDIPAFKGMQEKMKEDLIAKSQGLPKHDSFEQIPWATTAEQKLKKYYTGDTVTHATPSAEQSAAEYAMRVIKQTKTPSAEQLATKAEMEAKWKAWNESIDKKYPDPAASSKIFNIAKTYIGSMKAKMAAFEEKLDERLKSGLKNKYMEHLEPIDWQSVKSPLMGKQYETEENETVKRARELGFNVDFPLFKGGHSSPNKFESVPDPAKKNFERGIFYSDKYEIADSYASDTGQVGTYVARAPNAMVVDWKKATGYKNYDPDIMTPLIEAAHAKKADMLIVKNLYDVGGKQDQYVILNPSVVRRPDAAFDPEKLHLNHLLAGIGGMGVVAHEGLKQDKE